MRCYVYGMSGWKVLPPYSHVTAYNWKRYLRIHPIPGSYWHEDEAGIIGLRVLVRHDTPLHSILHEGCHTICMDQQRRAVLHTDAGGEYAEEDAVCYLQILLADLIPGFGRERMWQDMDAWGYTFRLGSAQRWFQEDAEDAREWLVQHGLLTQSGEIRFQLRQA